MSARTASSASRLAWISLITAFNKPGSQSRRRANDLPTMRIMPGRRALARGGLEDRRDANRLPDGGANRSRSVVWNARMGQAVELLSVAGSRHVSDPTLCSLQRVDLRQLWPMFAYPKVIAPGKVSQGIKPTVFHPRETDRKFNTRGRPAPCSR